MLYRIPVVVFLASACAAPSRLAVRPSWAAEASTEATCQIWLQRCADKSHTPHWRLRAARRAFLCHEAAKQDPGPALTAALKLQPKSPHTLELVERYLAAQSTPERLARLTPYLGSNPDLDATVLLGRAMASSSGTARRLYKQAAERDPDGQRGRRAMLALAKDSPTDDERIAWLRRALKPHRSVLASFGHAEFAGLSEAALRLAKLCKGSGDAECVAWAKARHDELER
jgi:hypothetical protein